VLVIDDEASVRAITRQTLEAFGYRVVLAGDGAEGVAMFARHMDEVQVVLTDMMMPVMDGAATIRALIRLKPTAKIIAASGLATKGQEAEAASSGGVKKFLPKPYTAGTILRALRDVLKSDSVETATRSSQGVN
jgi:two-component system cell cycle sensor histidine kinase/response regulator CckA